MHRSSLTKGSSTTAQVVGYSMHKKCQKHTVFHARLLGFVQVQVENQYQRGPVRKAKADVDPFDLESLGNQHQPVQGFHHIPCRRH